MAENSIPPVLFEILKSFTTLARTLNLSHSVEELGVTRQTVRRHIDTLEHLRGEKVFEVTGRQYNLTEAGHHLLPEANALLARAGTWLFGQLSSVNGLASTKSKMSSGDWFYAQRHPINSVWDIAPPLLKKGLQSWSLAKSQLEHREMKSIRPYMVVYRKHDDDWLCVNVGEKSSYATWLGQIWAKSAIGRKYMEDPVNSQADQFMVQAYDTAYQDGGVWYDHISTQFPREKDGVPCPISYQRIVFACVFPDGEPAVAALVARTNHIVIEGLDAKDIPDISASDLMEYDI